MNDNLLTPLKIKNITLKNRIVLPPMQVDLATKDGFITDKQIEHYVNYAPWVGLIIVEHAAVSLDGRYSFFQLGVWSEKHIEGLSKLTRRVHDVNGVIVLQINHAGGKTSKKVIGTTPKAPSSISLPYYPETPWELTKEEIQRIVNDFSKAAERAYHAGFDGVEIHGAHGFLLDEFWSPITNKRKDEYGGTLENRMRFPLEVVKAVRDAIPKEMLLLYRIGSTDLREDGVKIEESAMLSKKLVELGVDIIDVSGGLCGSRPLELQEMQGYFITQTEYIKKNINKPVIGGGGIKDPKVADRFIREKRVDLVFVGRAQLDDPKWAKKAIEMLGK